MNSGDTKQQFDRIEQAINELRDRIRSIDMRFDAINARILTMDRRIERFAGESETRDGRNLSVLRFEVENLRQLLRHDALRSSGPGLAPAEPKRPRAKPASRTKVVRNRAKRGPRSKGASR